MKTMFPRVAGTKLATGIEGFDDITGGGLPRGRTTLVMGGPGCGKTVFALQALVHGAHRAKEAGIFVAAGRKLSDLAKILRCCRCIIYRWCRCSGGLAF